jgi:hypothetical protein
MLRAYGCLTTLSVSVRLGERLVVRNIANGEEQDRQVVSLGEKQAAEPKLAFASKPPPHSSGALITHRQIGRQS